MSILLIGHGLFEREGRYDDALVAAVVMFLVAFPEPENRLQACRRAASFSLSHLHPSLRPGDDAIKDVSCFVAATAAAVFMGDLTPAASSMWAPNNVRHLPVKPGFLARSSHVSVRRET
jgi:hypothetical protein